MGKIKYLNRIREFFEESPVVSINSLKKFIKNDTEYIYLVVNNLIRKREIRRLTKGFYTIHENPSLTVFCFKPAYLGLQDALSAHNLWEQETNPVIVTVKKIRPGIRKVFGNSIIIRRISPKYFFGIDYMKQGDFYYPYSNIEKTFIDIIYYKQHLDEELTNEFKKRIDKKKLKTYLRKYPKRFREIVMKFKI